MDNEANSQLVEAEEQLADMFSHYYCVQQSATAPLIRRQLMPNYTMLLILNFGVPLSIVVGGTRYQVEQTAVLGPLQKTLHYELPPGTDVIVVNFTPGGFYRLVSSTDKVELPVDDVLLNPEAFLALWRQVAAHPKRVVRLRIINTYLAAHVPPADELMGALMAGIPYVEHTAIDPVKMLAHTRQISTRHIQMRLKTNLGYTAKALIRFVRFKALFSRLYAAPAAPIDWLALVHEHGYYDQSHLIRDFRYFIGVTPRQFLRQLAKGDICISHEGKPING